MKSLLRGRVQLGQAEDLGPGGLTLRRLPEQPAVPGAAIALTFALPGGGPLLRVAGVVVSDVVAGSFRRTGVRFTGIGGEVERRIAEFCATEQAAADAAVFQPRDAAASG